MRVARVSQRLVQRHLDSPRVRRMYELLTRDEEVEGYLRMSNTMAVGRLGYNDHGPVHSRICAGSALEIFELLTRSVTPTTVEEGLCDEEAARIISMSSAFLHDLGNSVHRVGHELHGCYLAAPVLDRLLAEVYPGDGELALRVKTEVLHGIYSHDEDVRCLTVEAGIAKVADGTDMAEGRARIPYMRGKEDMHSLSALSIKRVEIGEGEERPVRIEVHMDDTAGVFQIEEVLGRKIRTSGIGQWLEVVALERGERPRRFYY